MQRIRVCTQFRGLVWGGAPGRAAVKLVNVTIKDIAGDAILVARTSGIHTGTLLGDETVDIVR